MARVTDPSVGKRDGGPKVTASPELEIHDGP
jgi:hypothetical protein